VVVFGDDDVGDVVADWLQARAFGEQGGQGVEALDDAEAVGGDVVAGVDGEEPVQFVGPTVIGQVAVQGNQLVDGQAVVDRQRHRGS